MSLFLQKGRIPHYKVEYSLKKSTFKFLILTQKPNLQVLYSMENLSSKNISNLLFQIRYMNKKILFQKEKLTVTGVKTQNRQFLID